MKPTPVLPAQQGPPRDLLDAQIEPFLRYLRAAGYAERTLRKKRAVARAFARWWRRRQVPGEALIDSHLVAFVARGPRGRPARVRFELAALRPFLAHLRAAAGVPTPPQRTEEPLEQRYADYLRHERGLAESSLRTYLPHIRAFLTAQAARPSGGAPAAWDGGTVRDFLLARRRRRSSPSLRPLTAALRSFLRFCYLRGDTALDLALAIPPVRRWTPTAVPAVLAPAEVERVLATPDRATARGRRDHAILLLLARLGLRAGEVVALELGDLGWRTGEFLVRGKGGAQACLPLLADVGEALATYLRQGRGPSASRRVFLRLRAPRVGLGGPAAIGHIVRRALARAGLCPGRRGAAHLFRHSLATRLLRHGASLAEIAEVLRHRSSASTARYAQVDVDALRAVARPWPGAGGAQ